MVRTCGSSVARSLGVGNDAGPRRSFAILVPLRCMQYCALDGVVVHTVQNHVYVSLSS